jgi:hypothetical protein
MIDFFVELRSLLYFYINYYRCKLQGGYVAHHGIQRSGTNYLNEWLKLSGCKVINTYDPKRNDPRHKHFRWQDDKETIVLDKNYKNNVRAVSISELNSICGYKSGTKHIVIYRDPRYWLNGIYLWGIRSGWITESLDQNGIYMFLKGAAAEWLEYYYFWYSIQRINPESVCIISHSALINKDDSFNLLVNFLDLDFGSIDVKIENVSKSRGGVSDIDPDIVSIAIRILEEYRSECRFRDLEAFFDDI